MLAFKPFGGKIQTLKQNLRVFLAVQQINFRAREDTLRVPRVSVLIVALLAERHG